MFFIERGSSILIGVILYEAYIRRNHHDGHFDQRTYSQNRCWYYIYSNFVDTK